MQKLFLYLIVLMVMLMALPAIAAGPDLATLTAVPEVLAVATGGMGSSGTPHSAFYTISAGAELGELTYIDMAFSTFHGYDKVHSGQGYGKHEPLSGLPSIGSAVTGIARHRPGMILIS